MTKRIKKSDDDFKLDPKGFVSLPFNEIDFKEFIVGLLGKPQSIDNIIEGSFEIDKGVLNNVFSLIHQRISQQNESTLIQFTSRIVYEDESSVTLNSFDSLLAYNEIRPITSKEVHLTFQYLIYFKPKNIPEKQEINLSFIASETVQNLQSLKSIDIISPSALMRKYLRTKRYEQGYIQYNIKHTARSWGVDIDSLLSNFIENLLYKEGKLIRFLRDWNSLFSIATLIGILAIGIKFGKITYDKIQANKTEAFESLFVDKNQSLELISEQLKYIATEGIRDNSIVVFPIIIISLVIGMFAAFLTADSISKKRESHVLLTKKSIDEKDLKEKKYGMQVFNFFLTILLSIACSIAANYIFMYLTT